MKDKIKTKKTIKSSVEKLKKERGQVCDELNLDCPACKFSMLISCLEWYLDLLKWDDKIKNNVVAK